MEHHLNLPKNNVHYLQFFRNFFAIFGVYLSQVGMATDVEVAQSRRFRSVARRSSVPGRNISVTAAAQSGGNLITRFIKHVGTVFDILFYLITLLRQWVAALEKVLRACSSCRSARGK